MNIQTFCMEQTKRLSSVSYSVDVRTAILIWKALYNSPFCDICKPEYRQASIKMRRFVLRKMPQPRLPL
jgi:hypothetical protein